MPALEEIITVIAILVGLVLLLYTLKAISQSKQPLVPERVFAGSGGNGDNKVMGSNVLGDLISLLLAQNTAFVTAQQEENPVLKELADRMVRDAVTVLGQGQEHRDTPPPPKA